MRALNTMDANSGDILNFPAGNYDLTSGTHIPLKSGIAIQGVGETTRIKVNRPDFYVFFVLSGVSNTVVKNMKIEGYSPAQVGGQALISTSNSSYCTITGLRLQYSGQTGSYLLNTDGNTKTFANDFCNLKNFCPTSL